MKTKRSLYTCIWALVLASAVHMAAAAISDSADLFTQVLRIHSGRELPPATGSAPENSIPPTQITQPSATIQEQEAVVSFSSQDLELIRIQYISEKEPDVSALLQQPLQWELRGDAPRVLIVHTHTTESYSDVYQQTNYRSLDETKNMLAIGDEVARVLRLGGITVIHDRTIHDYPDYNGSYAAARKTIQAYLAQYPSIVMVLDLHRDASDQGQAQLITEATVGGQRSAQLMLVAGSDSAAAYYPNWEENLSLALKLSVLLEQADPGITRPVSLRDKRYNLDLTEGSLLVEVGAAGNTLQEALIAANSLAQAILTLAGGSQ